MGPRVVLGKPGRGRAPGGSVQQQQGVQPRVQQGVQQHVLQ